MAEMSVQLVAVERRLWSGTGTVVLGQPTGNADLAQVIDVAAARADLDSQDAVASVRAHGRLRAAGQRD